MNDHVSSLYTLAHELLNLGMDDSPIYSDHFARLNREVYEQALRLYSAPEGDTPEEEARLCLSILVALNATFMIMAANNNISSIFSTVVGMFLIDFLLRF